MTQSFNPNDHLIQLQSKDYLPVAWRLVWYREQCPEGCITTEVFSIDLDRETTDEVLVWNNDTKRKEKVMKYANGFVVFRAHVTDGKGGSATATKSEKAASFPDYIEKAETGAVGRALAMLGYGTQFTGDEFNEGERLADAPLERSTTPAAPVTKDQVLHELTRPGPARLGKQPSTPGPVADPTPASIACTEQQLASIRKLLQHLGLPEEIREDLRYLEAKEMIAELSRQYNEQRQKKLPPVEAELVNGDGTPATPKPYTLSEVQALFEKLYKPERWEAWKVNVIGKSVANADLSDFHLEMLQAALVAARKSMAR